MRSKQAWLQVFATVLGVSPAACHRADPTPNDAAPVSAPIVVPDASMIEVVTSTDAGPDVLDANVEDARDADASATDGGKHASKPSPTASLTEQERLLQEMQSVCGVVVHGACGASTNLVPGTGIGSSGIGSLQPPPPTPVKIDTVVVGATPQDERVVAASKPAFRTCAQKMLEQDPTVTAGSVTFEAKISPNGEVDSITQTAVTALPPSSTACMMRRLRNAEFVPSGTARTLLVTIKQSKP